MKKINRTVQQGKLKPSDKFENGVLFDNSVLYAVFDTKDHFHKKAKMLYKKCLSRSKRIWVPAHTWFEFNSTRLRRILSDEASFDVGIEIEINVLHIEEAFLERYYITDLPYIKGADYIYMAVAYVEELPLITQDGQLLSETKKEYIKAYTIDEYTSLLSKE